MRAGNTGTSTINPISSNPSSHFSNTAQVRSSERSAIPPQWLPLLLASWDTVVRVSSGQLSTIGKDEFNSRFRICPVVRYEWKIGQIHSVYVRTSPVPDAMDPYDYFTQTWRSTNNVLGTDFELYDSLVDVRANQRQWRYCNYDDSGVGYPRDCGKTGAVGVQWFAMPGSRVWSYTSKSGSFALFTGARCPSPLPACAYHALVGGGLGQLSSTTGQATNLYAFSGGETGYYIGDGGNDMYDNGNRLTIKVAGSAMRYIRLPYTNTNAYTSAGIGDVQYYTYKQTLSHGQLTAFVAQFTSASSAITGFKITGDNGADHAGSQAYVKYDSSTWTGLQNGWHGAFKQVYGAGDPSINHLVMAQGPITSQSIGATTNDDLHDLAFSSGVSKVVYVLWAGANGYSFSTSFFQSVAEALSSTCLPQTHVFTRKAELETAVQAYNANPTAAIATYGPIAYWDVSAITDMGGLFRDLKNFNADVSNWDTSSVTTMYSMFWVRCPAP